MTDTIKISRELAKRIERYFSGFTSAHFHEHALGDNGLAELRTILAQPPEQPGAGEREAFELAMDEQSHKEYRAASSANAFDLDVPTEVWRAGYIAGINRARAALSSASEGWRDHSVQFAKGEKCPDTVETLQAAWDRDQELIDDMRKEIASLKQKLNQARQASQK